MSKLYIHRGLRHTLGRLSLVERGTLVNIKAYLYQPMLILGVWEECTLRTIKDIDTATQHRR